jgi:hypothetical protein
MTHDHDRLPTPDSGPRTGVTPDPGTRARIAARRRQSAFPAPGVWAVAMAVDIITLLAACAAAYWMWR